MWPAKSKIVTIWPLAEKVCRPWSRQWRAAGAHPVTPGTALIDTPTPALQKQSTVFGGEVQRGWEIGSLGEKQVGER